MKFIKDKKIIALIIAIIVVVIIAVIVVLTLTNKDALKRNQKVNYQKGAKSYEEAITGAAGGKELSKEEREQNYKNAISSLEKVVKVEPTNLESLLKVASSYYNLGNLDKAAETLKKATEIDPLNATLYNNLGNVLRDQNKLAEAKTYYKKAIELDAKYSTAYINLAVLLKDLENNKTEAIKVLGQGIEKNPEDALLKGLLSEYKK